jgi:opacity protein-like surface antigen
MTVTVENCVRRAVATTLFLAAAAVATPALAQDSGGGYVSVGGGLAHRQKAGESPTTYTLFKKGYGLNVAAGGETKTGVAIEGEYSHFSNKAKTVASDATGPATGQGSISLDFFFLNVRYTVPSQGPVQVYLGGGVGGYKSTLHDISNSIAAQFGLFANGKNDGVVLAYQGRAGVEFKVSDRVKIGAGYRYVRGRDLLFVGTDFGDLRPDGATLHNAEANVRFRF